MKQNERVCEKVGVCEVTWQEFYPQGSETSGRAFSIAQKALFRNGNVRGWDYKCLCLRTTECRVNVN